MLLGRDHVERVWCYQMLLVVSWCAFSAVAVSADQVALDGFMVLISWFDSAS